MSAHRKAPLPESMKRFTPKGQCRWCDKPIADPNGKPTKQNWHRECVTAFKLIHWPAVTRREVFERDRGVCARCRRDLVAERISRHPELSEKMAKGYTLHAGRDWQHDHIRPLVEANGDIRFWQLDNIQTLCTPCHVEKGKEDNARRRAAKRAGIQTLLFATSSEA